MPRQKAVTKAEIAAAVKALKLNTPIRAAERKGASIILHTRSGDFTYTPRTQKSGSGTTPRKARAKKPPAE